jgi:hypothetical protein
VGRGAVKCVFPGSERIRVILIGMFIEIKIFDGERDGFSFYLIILRWLDGISMVLVVNIFILEPRYLEHLVRHITGLFLCGGRVLCRYNWSPNVDNVCIFFGILFVVLFQVEIYPYNVSKQYLFCIFFIFRSPIERQIVSSIVCRHYIFNFFFNHLSISN